MSARTGFYAWPLDRLLAYLKEGPATPRRLLGRCSDGAERGAGTVWHSVPARSYFALCGATYGRNSAGWIDPANVAPDQPVTCARCARFLDRLFHRTA